MFKDTHILYRHTGNAILSIDVVLSMDAKLFKYLIHRKIRIHYLLCSKTNQLFVLFIPSFWFCIRLSISISTFLLYVKLFTKHVDTKTDISGWPYRKGSVAPRVLPWGRPKVTNLDPNDGAALTLDRIVLSFFFRRRNEGCVTCKEVVIVRQLKPVLS